MGSKEAAARDQELVELAQQATALAQRAEEEGRLATASQMYAVATFFRDCVSTRVVRFRTRATPRARRSAEPKQH